MNEKMSRHEALRIAMSEMSHALNAIDEMDGDAISDLITPPDDIREAMRVIDGLMREIRGKS
jgi:hypothetical protein